MFTEQNGSLRAEVVGRDFVDAFAMATRVAMIAEAQGHHPDLSISWNRLTISCTTHSAGNVVTDRDRALAAAIEEALS
jgi:4a-hydroxytetrahydrobiopterin dehydratase